MRPQQVLKLPFVPLIVVAVALFGPMLVMGKAMFWGTPLFQFAPWWRWAWETVLSGSLPLWNTDVGMGAPLVANYQSALFYPPNWLYLFLYTLGDVTWLAWGQGLLAAFHLAWAGFGMAALVRRLGLGNLAQTIGGLAFAFSGYLVSRAGFLSINAAAAWLPWVLWCLTPSRFGQVLDRKRFVVLSLCAAAQLLTGHAQTTWYTLLLAGMWSGFWAWSGAFEFRGERNSGGWFGGMPGVSVLRVWLWFALALLLAVGLAAVQLFPTAEYLAQSQRSAAVEYEYAMNYSFWPWRLLTLFAANFFGNPVTGDYWGYANYWEDAIYVGLLPLLLALGAVFGLIRRRRTGAPPVSEPGQPVMPATRNRLVGFLIVLFLLALLLALGKNTPVFPWLYNHVPTFGLFQAPTRYMIWAEFALALLAALGAQAWRRPQERDLYWTRLGTAGAFAVSLGAGAAWILMGDISPSFIRSTALAGLWGICAGGLSLLAPESDADLKSRGAAWWRWGVAFLVSLDLFVAGWGLNPAIDVDLYRPPPNAAALRSQLDGRRLYFPAAHEDYIKYTRFLRFDTFDPAWDWRDLRASLLPNINLLDDIATANNFDPLVPGRYAQWMAHLDGTGLGFKNQLLNLMHVGVVEKVDERYPYGIRFDPLEGSRRVRWVSCAVWAADEKDSWRKVMDGQVDFDAQVVLEAPPGEVDTHPGISCAQDLSSAEGELTVLAEHHITWIPITPNRLEVHMTATEPGWLVLSDIWYPGWRAWVDGERVPILRANYLFRAVAVPAGEHRIEFAYQPLSFALSVPAALVAWLVLALLWRARRLRPPAIAQNVPG